MRLNKTFDRVAPKRSSGLVLYLECWVSSHDITNISNEVGGYISKLLLLDHSLEIQMIHDWTIFSLYWTIRPHSILTLLTFKWGFIKVNEENWLFSFSSVLPKIIKIGFQQLQLEYFFTAGKDEVKAWTIQVSDLMFFVFSCFWNTKHRHSTYIMANP